LDFKKAPVPGDSENQIVKGRSLSPREEKKRKRCILSCPGRGGEKKENLL